MYYATRFFALLIVSAIPLLLGTLAGEPGKAFIYSTILFLAGSFMILCYPPGEVTANPEDTTPSK